MYCLTKSLSQSVLWSRSNLDRFRPPAPANKMQVKNAGLKTKVNNFAFFFKFVYKLLKCD